MCARMNVGYNTNISHLEIDVHLKRIIVKHICSDVIDVEQLML